MPDETKDKARDAKNRSLDYVKGKMPKERREQSIWRLKKMIVEIQGHQDCKLPTASATRRILINPRPASNRNHTQPR